MGDWLPRRRDEQMEMARTWVRTLPSSGGAWVVAQEEIDKLEALVDAARDAMDDAARDRGSEVENARVREAFAAMTRFMRLLHQRRFFSPPMQDSDWLRLGLRPRDTVRTPHIDITEVVEFELRLRNIREVVVNFWIKGADHKAKPSGYDGAVIVWDILEEPPAGIHNLTQHTMASRTPHAIEFTEEERGLTVYIAAAWQNERGMIGSWSEILNAVIP